MSQPPALPSSRRYAARLGLLIAPALTLSLLSTPGQASTPLESGPDARQVTSLERGPDARQVTSLERGPDALPATHPAPMLDQTRGHHGWCLDDRGVTVVVDFQDLGGESVLRCALPAAPGQPFQGTGLDALKAAGIEVTGTDRWGEGFICRLEGRPAIDEQIPITGDPTYTEPCIDTPPAAAYWSYWWGDNDLPWTYSQLGVTNRSAIPGGFEGWSFALNATAQTNPAPRIEAQRPLVYRLSGSNRYATGEQISLRYPAGVDVAYVATGAGFADALAASALAGHQEVPVLLTSGTQLSTETARELVRLDPQQIVVLGGSAAVADTVVGALQQIAPTTRWQGSNRFETAALVAGEFPTGVSTVYVATGVNFPDALAASALAGVEGSPVLLTRHGQLPGATITQLERLSPGRIVVLGGEGVVSAAVLGELAGYTDGPVLRWSGSNRYATAARVAEAFDPGVDVAFLATGAGFADALAGSALAARVEGPVLLTGRTDLPEATRAQLERLGPGAVIALGGNGVIDDAVLDVARGYVNP